jgi:hypothetical protein
MNGAPVKAYSKAKDGGKKLSEHFRVREFACKDGSDVVFVSDGLVQVLEAMRMHFANEVIVTSGYGEKYPHGLVIGEIVEVGVDTYDRSPYAYVRLYADYSSTATLMIVTGEANETENNDSGNTEQNDKNSDQAGEEVSGDGS